MCKKMIGYVFKFYTFSQRNMQKQLPLKNTNTNQQNNHGSCQKLEFGAVLSVCLTNDRLVEMLNLFKTNHYFHGSEWFLMPGK